jgi:hypothetical protein
MYERPSDPLLPRSRFYLRVFFHLIVIAVILLISLSLGIAGYHFLVGLPWIDSLLNASMILGGMGPVDPIETDGGKLFASFYALFSGMVFVITAGILFSPIAHRFLHWANLELVESDGESHGKTG